MALGARDSDSLTIEQNETITFVSRTIWDLAISVLYTILTK
jgi:hypothetical protein